VYFGATCYNTRRPPPASKQELVVSGCCLLIAVMRRTHRDELRTIRKTADDIASTSLEPPHTLCKFYE
jgi:hypothetical protein